MTQSSTPASENSSSSKAKTYEAGSLIDATSDNDVERIKKILTDTAYPVNETNAKNENALLIATHNNYVEAAKLLVDAGVDINQQDNIQDSPYLYAGAQGKTEILTYMLAHSTPDQKKYNRFGGNALIPAAEKGHLDNVRLLLQDGRVDIDHQNHYGYTALIEAVALTNGSELYQKIVRELLDHGANKELKDNTGKTASDYARQLGYTAIATLLDAS